MKDWLAQTGELQRVAYGKDLGDMTHDERVEYVRVMLLALVDETMEALHEFSWKPWQTATYFNREAFIGELVDAGHFLANCAVAVGCTDDEWDAAYLEKMERNRERQRQGYTGVNKCNGCKRAADDVVAHGGTFDGIYCNECG